MSLSEPISLCEPEIRKTFVYQYIECPYNIAYNVWVAIIIPDFFIMAEVVLMAWLINKVQKRINKMRDPIYQGIYNIITYYLLRFL